MAKGKKENGGDGKKMAERGIKWRREKENGEVRKKMAKRERKWWRWEEND